MSKLQEDQFIKIMSIMMLGVLMVALGLSFLLNKNERNVYTAEVAETAAEGDSDVLGSSFGNFYSPLDSDADSYPDSIAVTTSYTSSPDSFTLDTLPDTGVLSIAGIILAFSLGAGLIAFSVYEMQTGQLAANSKIAKGAGVVADRAESSFEKLKKFIRRAKYEIIEEERNSTLETILQDEKKDK